MNLRHKKPRPLAREEKTYRDDRLFVIATEDTYAPEQYFRIFRNSRIKVRVLPTSGGLSAPEHVLERLAAFTKEFELTSDDQTWLMLDTDHWAAPNHIPNLNRVCAQATQRGARLAHSNPCFEVWLLLHVTDLDAGDQFTTCAEVEQRLRNELGQYNKTKLDLEHYSIGAAALAVDRASRLDKSPTDRWPQETGSHVYRIVQQLLPG